ncbi:MFS transporter [Paralcaligenes ureilyticus]|uniref:Putative MFS transporter n=1 Tax=Paralcaligenes ureilyticus TaxID=627131 RepID=A0A4R3M8B7_9BURK|nr:MFS transporter [Paralcaligenes ureilyticus]TCT09620.1 putative MFS transporter [Paralcaligenes ureilyticus]
MNTQTHPQLGELGQVEANLLARLDNIPITRGIWTIIGLVTMVWIIEAFDIGMIGSALVFLKQTWPLTSAQTGMLGSAGTFGIVIGLLPAGWLADRYGRKKVLLVGVTVFSAFTYFGVFTTNINQLAVLRFVAGLGEGAVFTAPYLIIAEFVNKKRRGEAVGWANFLLTAAYVLPNAAGVWTMHRGFSAALSWHILFSIGGALIIIVPVLWLWLPESPRFLLKRGKVDEVRRMIERFEDEARLPHDTALTNADTLSAIQAAADRRWGFRDLLRQPYLKRAFVSYCALGSPLALFYAMLVYGPTIFAQMGFGSSNSLLYVGCLQVVSGFGTILASFCSDRFGRPKTHATFMFIAAVCLVLVGLQLPTPFMIAAAVMAWFFGLGGFAMSKLYMSEQFPTQLRATGAATGEVVTRFLLGVVMVYYIPALLKVLHAQGLFMIFGLAMALLVLPLLLVGIETAGRSVEETGKDGILS